MEEIANMQLLLPDSDTLYDASVGFEVETNIKTPMLGFSSSYQDYFFPLIDAQSGVLFEIVQVCSLKFMSLLIRAVQQATSPFLGWLLILFN